MGTRTTDIANQTFDFVIAGGGTAGLTLAARLTEDPAISVAVLEAGEANLGDPKIDIPAQFGQRFGDPKYDYGFQTTKQIYSNNNVYEIPSGKGLGGSSALNFYSWTKPPAGDVNAFEKLGNPGWNWEEFKKYSRFAETFKPASENQAGDFEATYHGLGTTGPVQTRALPHFTAVEELIQEALAQKGLKKIADPYQGDITGTWWSAGNLDSKWKRSYAATAYYVPNKGRQNLKVLTEATVSRILFADAEPGEDLTATGLEFIHAGKAFVVKAKEVIISAGAVKSPQILELSGIGRDNVLSLIGVDTKLNLPGVGENVQEHYTGGIIYELGSNIEGETWDLMRDSVYATNALRLHEEGKGIMRKGITSFSYFPLSVANPQEAPALIKKLENDIDELKQSGQLPPGQAEQFDIQLETLQDNTLPDCEIIGLPGLRERDAKRLTPDPTKKYVSMLFVAQHPFSRGTIHVKSKNPFDYPEIDPHYFEVDFDLELMVQQFKFIRSLTELESWKSGTQSEIDPGPEVQTDKQIRDHIKNTLASTYHAAGSCSMMPRNKQGVVDEKLKVYGTTNLRVVDLSIVPIHVASHTQTLAYAIGEKASDIIRGIVRK